MRAWRFPRGWGLLFLVFLGLLAEVHGSAAALPRLFPTEVRTLRRIAAKMGLSHWNFSFDPCNSGFAENVTCDCSFYNHTICHVTQMYG